MQTNHLSKYFIIIAVVTVITSFFVLPQIGLAQILLPEITPKAKAQIEPELISPELSLEEINKNLKPFDLNWQQRQGLSLDHFFDRKPQARLEVQTKFLGDRAYELSSATLLGKEKLINRELKKYNERAQKYTKALEKAELVSAGDIEGLDPNLSQRLRGFDVSLDIGQEINKNIQQVLRYGAETNLINRETPILIATQEINTQIERQIVQSSTLIGVYIIPCADLYLLGGDNRTDRQNNLAMLAYFECLRKQQDLERTAVIPEG